MKIRKEKTSSTDVCGLWGKLVACSFARLEDIFLVGHCTSLRSQKYIILPCCRGVISIDLLVSLPMLPIIKC